MDILIEEYIMLLSLHYRPNNSAWPINNSHDFQNCSFFLEPQRTYQTLNLSIKTEISIIVSIAKIQIHFRRTISHHLPYLAAIMEDSDFYQVKNSSSRWLLISLQYEVSKCIGQITPYQIPRIVCAGGKILQGSCGIRFILNSREVLLARVVEETGRWRLILYAQLIYIHPTSMAIGLIKQAAMVRVSLQIHLQRIHSLSGVFLQSVRIIRLDNWIFIFALMSSHSWERPASCWKQRLNGAAWDERCPHPKAVVVHDASAK